MEDYYRVMLDDHSVPSFVSLGKSYYGTLEQIGGLFGEVKKDAALAERHQDSLSAYERAAGGEAGVTHYVARKEEPFLVPVDVLRASTSVLTDYAWEHLNAWGCSYFLKCERAESTHIWTACNGEYSRCIQTQFSNLQYGVEVGERKPLGGDRWGFPCQISGPAGSPRNRLLVKEKTFESEAEALEDYAAFLENPGPNFTEFLNDIFGDG